MSKRPTLLLVDDTKNNLDILIELLGDKYEIIVALDGLTALEIVSNNDIDLMLLDIMMPQINGYEVCSIIKSNLKTQEIPIIFITAFSDESSIEKAYKTGGVDYITKPFIPVELLYRVKTQLGIHKLIKHLNYISSHDTMTNILNRKSFFKLGEEKFMEDKDKLFAIMIDIDNFKEINDKHGHHIGDKVIKIVTKTISDSISDESIFGRLGGEEFALLYPENNTVTMMSKMEEIREKIENLNVISDNNEPVKCTISTGMVKNDENIFTLGDILKEADKAMYQAKDQGRNKSILRA